MQKPIKQLFPEFNTPPLLSDELEKMSIMKSFEEETTILNPDDYVRFIPLVIKGSLKVMQEDESGKEILLYYVKIGESCIMSILASNSGATSQIKAIAEPNTEVLLLPSHHIHQLTATYPAWNTFVQKLYHKRFEELLQVVNELAFNKIDERLKELLHKKTQLLGNYEIQTTHQQLADELGTAREVVSRLLKILESEGKIKIFRGKIKIISLV
ncbi:MAG: Crp/Fnr family transcriptional regulator [Thermoflexibacter sp.]|jgi:CRP/FNR family transcriptional regulator|nr:Crp/Fnr family transcriptional regulator [Thermoflexibacter sp.]